MVWFKPKPPVDFDEFEWLMACLAWLHEKMAPQDQADGFVPILARPDTPGLAEADGATTLFHAVKALAGLQNWDCELRQGESGLPRALPTGVIDEQFGSKALGTFSFESAKSVPRYGQFGERVDEASKTDSLDVGAVPVIHYDPELLRDPEALTATLAHELAHLVGHSLGRPPGGEDLIEHATDCIAVYLGFGIFLANTARNFSQFSDGTVYGWSSRTAGYLSEQALVTALVMYVRLFGFPPEQASEPLKGYLKVDFKKALKYIDWRYPDFPAALEQVELSDWT